MRLLIDENVMYCDGLRLCLTEPGNGRPNLPVGCFEVEIRLAPTFEYASLPFADGLGFLGAADRCDVLLGAVRGGDGLIPCDSVEQRVSRLVENALARGQRVTLETK